MKTIQIQKLSENATVPVRAYEGDAGLDLSAAEDFLLPPHEGFMVSTGLAIAVPEQHVGMICDRSSMGKKGIRVLGGIVDAGYRGEVKVVLWNLTANPQSFKKGERIAQLLLMPIATPAVEAVTELTASERGQKGFGSSGK